MDIIVIDFVILKVNAKEVNLLKVKILFFSTSASDGKE
jgi:hypothetical protein